MKKTLLFFSILLSVLSFSQKNNLKNFQIVSYEIESPDKITFNSYSRISGNGKLDVFINGYRGNAYYSYQLDENEIKKLNELGKDHPENFVERRHLQPNEGYAGSRNYISFSKNGKQQSICFIIPFMNSDFKEVLKMLEDKIYSQKDAAKIPGFKIDFEKLENEILKQNEIDNYLPQKSLPPPSMR